MKKSESKKRGLKHLTSSVLLITVAFLLAVTATLAWFSMNIASSVQGILFEVTTQESLLIAVKQWKYREVTAKKVITSAVEVTYDDETEGYIYEFGEAVVTAKAANIYKTDNKYYVNITDGGVEVPREMIVSEGGQSFVYLNESNTPIDSALYSSVETAGDSYRFSGQILVEPELEDYTHEITEAALSKIVMNHPDATKITDALTNATTRNDEDGNALSISDLVDVYGNSYAKDVTAGGHRFTTVARENNQLTAFKYEFDLYFLAEVDYGMVLNTLASNVRSEPNDGKSSYDVKAWKDMIIDNYTTDINMKNYYGANHGSREEIAEGTKIFAQAKNAIRIGFSTAEGEPIAIWDPHSSFGWTKNEPENNLGLEYFNYVGNFQSYDGFSEAYGMPAKANLNSSTYLYDNMEVGSDGKYRAHIRLTIWLEGFDADCFNAISNEVLKFSFDFAARPSKALAQQD